MFDSLLSFDRDILIFINSLGSESYDFFWLIVTQQAYWTPFFLIFFIGIFLNIDRKQFMRLMLTVVIVLLIVLFLTEGIKELTQRLRPSQESSLQNTLRILIRPKNYSFFSGHASTSFAVATLLWLFLRKRIKWISFFFLWPMLFAYSRLYLGLHYPSDILVGILFGSLIAFWAYRLMKNKLKLNFNN